MNANVSPKLNWGKELKFEASPTAPSKKQMSEQDIGIQHATTNSSNAESPDRKTQLTEPELNFRKLLYIS